MTELEEEKHACEGCGDTENVDYHETTLVESIAGKGAWLCGDCLNELSLNSAEHFQW